MVVKLYQINSKAPASLIRVDKMYESLRYNDLPPASGLGEIVDNSVDAGAANIAVFVVVQKVRNSACFIRM